ncbi:MAG: spore coat associated protein CotJA [Ruminococcaceae bacterium]|nr:spore coat associated protein CotJA [Oscillospiraceae bacterium]
MVYSPVQYWRDIYDIDRALERGTLFAELDKPLCSAGR